MTAGVTPWQPAVPAAALAMAALAMAAVAVAVAGLDWLAVA
jgi:hypothetical protein